MKDLTKTDVLILGAGIGGYETFRTLSKLMKRKGIKKKITIVDKNNYFTFIPMLHEVAAGSIEPTHCAVPLRELVHGTAHEFIKAEVKGIDPDAKIVATSEGRIAYDFCVVALGSGTNYFNIPGAGVYTHHVRDLNAAMALHNKIIDLLEDNSTKNINIVVAGGGFTGVEIAGQFYDLADKDVRHLYPRIRINISIIESRELLLKFMPDKVRKKITQRFKNQGINIYLNSRVKEVQKDCILLEDEKKIPSDLTIWTTGFENIANRFLPESYVENGRIPVGKYLNHPKADSLYAVGDIMFRKDPKSDIPYPQLAEAAHKEGEYVARHIVERLAGKKYRKSFIFKAKGTLMPIGDWYGVMVIGPFILFGPLAWWIRRTVYLFFMPGLIRKIKIAIDWTLHSFGFRYIIEMNSKKK